MKLSISLSFIFLLTMVSCGDDASVLMEECLQGDWVGTYMGTQQCDEETPDFMILARVIETGESSDEIIYDGDSYQIIDCTAEAEGFDTTRNATWVTTLKLLPGDSIMITTTYDIIGGISCRYSGQK